MARVGDVYACPKHGNNPIVTGAKSVLGEGKLVAHVDSRTACGATIVVGSPDTFVGDPTPYPVPFLRRILEEKTYVEFQLITENEVPILYEKFTLTLPDNSVIEGELDSEGFVHIDNIPRGTCHIVFPDLSYEKVLEYA